MRGSERLGRHGGGAWGVGWGRGGLEGRREEGGPCGRSGTGRPGQSLQDDPLGKPQCRLSALGSLWRRRGKGETRITRPRGCIGPVCRGAESFPPWQALLSGKVRLKRLSDAFVRLRIDIQCRALSTNGRAFRLGPWGRARGAGGRRAMAQARADPPPRPPPGRGRRGSRLTPRDGLDGADDSGA